MDIDYVAQYMSINFDNMVTNDLVNSEEFYLKYKRNYFERTNENYKMFSIYVDELRNMTNIQRSVSGTKYTYVYVDTDRLQDLKQRIKNIIIAQNVLLDNLNHHIVLLNTNHDKFRSVSNKTDRRLFNKRNFLKTMFTKN